MKIVDRYYSFDDICSKANCIEIAKTIGLKLNSENRCPAVWRNGTNDTSVSISETGWHDFGSGDSGSVIKLVSLVKFGGKDELQEAQMWLGDHLGLEVKMRIGKERIGREEYLHKEGYKCVEVYKYENERGKTVHSVERWEHPQKRKQFLQKDGNGKAGVKNIKTLLYKLPEWIDSDYVCICEGEKDVHTIKKLGYLATTNPSGASRWENYYTDWLNGKDVIIFVDNDEAGEDRGEFLLSELKNVCPRIKIVDFKGETKGFDVTDYVQKYSEDKLKDIIEQAKPVNKDIIAKPKHNYNELQSAKEANQKDFSNYVLINNLSEAGGKVTYEYRARHINDMIKDIQKRLLNFPRLIGSTLFDHDKDTDEIVYIHSAESLIMWISRKTKKVVPWKNGGSFVSKRELFEALCLSVKKYEEIAMAPVIPIREEVYESYPPLPPADKKNKYFYGLIDKFLPATESDRIMLMSFFASPMWYIPGVPKPCFVIDSPDGQGSGKTKVVELCANLYNTDAIRTDQRTLKNNFDEVTKRLVSATGRRYKILLLDNVSGTFASGRFADMVTATSISGRPPYGHGEETRPNNLTYVVTSNDAIIDSDMAERSLFINVKKPVQYNVNWLSDIRGYINNYRYQIFADMINILADKKGFEAEPNTRFPDFERAIMQQFCSSFNKYNELIKSILTQKAESNIEEDYAEQIRDRIRENLVNINVHHDEAVFIRSSALLSLFPNGKFDEFKNSIQLIRNLAKRGSLHEVDTSVRLFPTYPKELRARGLMWNYAVGRMVKIIGVGDNNSWKIIAEKPYSNR